MNFFLAICLLTLASNIDENAGVTPPPVQWLNLDQALSKAKTVNKPLFIYFSAEWCVYCKKMERRVFSEKDVQNYLNGQFIPVRIDGESENNLKGIKSPITSREFRKQFDISAYPTFIILSPEGAVLTKWTGYSSKSELLGTYRLIR